MKRRKDGENVMGPMFPRLHVNDAHKGGPRAPPRNKMALYEQLSIPSQRFNPALLPVNANSNNSVPQSSSSQVCGLDRKNFFAIHLPPSKPTFHPEKLNGLKSDRSDTGTSFARLGQRNKSVDEDDFTVPIFAHSQESQDKHQSSKENENFMPLNPNHMRHHSTRIQTQNSGPEKNLIEPENIDEEESEEVDKCSCSSGNNESPMEIEVADASEPRWDFPSGDTNRSQDVSKASILDSISVMDISSDDVVGIIGQKHFWKARRAIVNQQRVFAVQVFELHRLIKVQKLIAGSPHLLLEDTFTNTSKPSSKSSSATKRLAENNDKSLSPAMKHGDKPKKPTHPVECSAENAVGRTPVLANKSALPGPPTVSSSGTWCQPQHHPLGQQQWLIPVMSPTEGLVYKPYSGPGLSSTDFCGSYGSSTMMMGNFGNPAYGVLAHHGMGFVPGIPHAGHSYFPTYGMPVMSSGVPSSGYRSISTVEPGNRLTESTPAVQTGHILRQQPNRPKPQNTCNNNSVQVPRPAPVVARLQTSKVSDIQGSTGSSSPNDRTETTQTGLSQNPSRSNEMQGTDSESFSLRAEGFENGRRDDGKDELPLFPMVPASAEADPSTRVIRAVPHNARTASASAAQIFRSIQEGRKHYDSV